VLVIAATDAWIITSIAAGFQTLVEALTWPWCSSSATPRGHQRATQCKLGKVLRALPDAGNSLLTLEHVSDDRRGLQVSGQAPARAGLCSLTNGL
jgi:hypothetical protein